MEQGEGQKQRSSLARSKRRKRNNDFLLFDETARTDKEFRVFLLPPSSLGNFSAFSRDPNHHRLGSVSLVHFDGLPDDRMTHPVLSTITSGPFYAFVYSNFTIPLRSVRKGNSNFKDLSSTMTRRIFEHHDENNSTSTCPLLS